VHRRTLIVLSLSTACAPAVSPPGPTASEPPPASSSAPPHAASAGAADPVEVAPRGRRGACDLREALDAFLAGQAAVNCGDLPSRPASADYERARACVLDAQRARKPFMLVWGGAMIDSIMREAVAARLIEGRYEVRWFSYDSCPSGCGDLDPVWSSMRCEPLADLRAECAAFSRTKTAADEEVRWLCHEDMAEKTRRQMELRCVGRAAPEMCGPPPP
jgi:hypothetical protein